MNILDNDFGMSPLYKELHLYIIEPLTDQLIGDLKKRKFKKRIKTLKEINLSFGLF